MPKLYLGEALSLLFKTMPFVWLRLGSYLVLGLGLGIYFGVIGGVAWLLGQLWAPLGFIVFLVAFFGAIGIVRWASRYYFYLLKAGHTAVMTEFIVHGTGPNGPQVAYGKEQVLSRFRDTSILFGVDVLVDAVVKAVVRTLTRIVGILPIPGLNGIGKLLERVAVQSTTFIDEAILSRAYKEREANVWKVAQDGIVLYAQAWKPILANAVVLVVLGYLEFVLFVVVLGLPAIAIGALVPGLRLALGIAVLVGAWMLKLALSDAYSLAVTLLAYHRATDGLEVDPVWKGKIETVSEKFKELGRKATEAFRTPERKPAGAANGSTADHGVAVATSSGTLERSFVAEADATAPSTTSTATHGPARGVEPTGSA